MCRAFKVWGGYWSIANETSENFYGRKHLRVNGWDGGCCSVQKFSFFTSTEETANERGNSHASLNYKVSDGIKYIAWEGPKMPLMSWIEGSEDSLSEPHERIFNIWAARFDQVTRRCHYVLDRRFRRQHFGAHERICKIWAARFEPSHYVGNKLYSQWSYLDQHQEFENCGATMLHQAKSKRVGRTEGAPIVLERRSDDSLSKQHKKVSNFWAVRFKQVTSSIYFSASHIE